MTKKPKQAIKFAPLQPEAPEVIPVTKIIDNAIDLARQHKPQQHYNELLPFLEFCIERGVKKVLEIGIGSGGTTFIFSELFESVVGVDRTIRLNYEKENVITVPMDTQHPDPKQMEFIKGTYDLIFIDGLHTEAGVGNDYHLFKSMLSDGGILAFHDIKESEGERIIKGKKVHRDYSCTVSDFIKNNKEELESNFKNHKEFIDWNDTWMAVRVTDMTNFCGIGCYYN